MGILPEDRSGKHLKEVSEELSSPGLRSTNILGNSQMFNSGTKNMMASITSPGEQFLNN